MATSSCWRCTSRSSPIRCLASGPAFRPGGGRADCFSWGVVVYLGLVRQSCGGRCWRRSSAPSAWRWCCAMPPSGPSPPISSRCRTIWSAARFDLGGIRIEASRLLAGVVALVSHPGHASAADAHDARQPAAGGGRGPQRGHADGHPSGPHAGPRLGVGRRQRRHRRRVDRDCSSTSRPPWENRLVADRLRGGLPGRLRQRAGRAAGRPHYRA